MKSGAHVAMSSLRPGWLMLRGCFAAGKQQQELDILSQRHA